MHPTTRSLHEIILAKPKANQGHGVNRSTLSGRQISTGRRAAAVLKFFFAFCSYMAVSSRAIDSRPKESPYLGDCVCVFALSKTPTTNVLFRVATLNCAPTQATTHRHDLSALLAKALWAELFKRVGKIKGKKTERKKNRTSVCLLRLFEWVERKNLNKSKGKERKLNVTERWLRRETYRKHTKYVYMFSYGKRNSLSRNKTCTLLCPCWYWSYNRGTNK